MTKLQKQAWYMLGIFVFVAIHISLLILGIEWLTAIVGLTGYSVAGFLVVRYLLARRKRKRSQIETDERDKMVLSKVPALQLVITLVVLAVWGSIFIFKYGTDSEVSVKLVMWMIMSSIFASSFAYPVCILIAYWWANRTGRALESET